jgi:hypothetical protein
MEDAGIGPGEIDGMMSYSGNDSTPSPPVAADLGIRLPDDFSVCPGRWTLIVKRRSARVIRVHRSG